MQKFPRVLLITILRAKTKFLNKSSILTSQNRKNFTAISPLIFPQKNMSGNFFNRSIQFAKEERKTMVLISVCLFQPGSVSLSKKMLENVERRFAPFKEAMRERFRSYGVKEPDKEMILIKTFLHGVIMSQHFNDTTTCTPTIIEMVLERYDYK